MNYKKEYKKYLISSTLDTANNRIASASFISAFAIYLELYGFMILFTIVFIIAFIDITIRIKTYKPDVIQEKIGFFSFHSFAVIPNNATFKTSASLAYTYSFCFSVNVGTMFAFMLLVCIL